MEGPDAQADLRKHARIKHAGKELLWSNFFFSLQKLYRFADKIECGKIRHPVALLLHVPSKRQSIKERKSAVRFTPMLDHHAPTDTHISVRAYGEESILDQLKPDQHYIVFGRFWHLSNRRWTSDDKALTIDYRNFAVTLFQLSQIAWVEVVDPSREAGTDS